MTKLRSVCPLNCPDSCTFIVEISEGEIRVSGEHNEITQGFICSKGKAYAQRAREADRIHFPLLKYQGGFKRISWDEAYEILQQKIEQAIAKAGPQAILHLFDYAHSGVLRELDRRFFQCLGGVTEPSGSMCWGAGYEAQILDFGAVYSSHWSDLEHARLIILWGRDPAVTNLHLVPYLIKARKNGAHIIVINPIRVKSCDFADEFIQIRPGTDGLLALGIAHYILKERWLDLEFVQAHVSGFEQYARMVGSIDPAQVAEQTGVPLEAMRELARKFKQKSPVSLILGYGMQRYVHGGETVRAIDALAAITGNIGKPGAGIAYAHQYHRFNLNSLSLPDGAYRKRQIPHGSLAEQLRELNPAIELVVVTRTNPLIQQPNTELWKEVWSQILFKVTLDYVLSETARASDLVLPITTIFEEEELVATSWSPLLQYVQPVCAAQGEAKPEPLIFIELAKRMGLKQFEFESPRQAIEYVIEPLKSYGITLESLRQKAILAPYIPQVAWEDLQFETPSGKIELLSDYPYLHEVAVSESGDKVDSENREKTNLDNKANTENQVNTDNKANTVNRVKRPLSSEYPWHLLTPHPRQSIHSQFMEDDYFRIWIHPQLAKLRHLRNGDWALVETEVGQLKGRVVLSEDIHPETVVIPEGAALDGFGVNRLIRGQLSTLGQSTSYYDVRCEIRKWLVD